MAGKQRKTAKEARRAEKAERRDQKLKRREAGQAAGLQDERTRVSDAYEREDRAGANVESRRLLAGNRPILDDLQSNLVAGLREDGIARVKFSELFSTDLWQRLTADAATFTAAIERDLVTNGEGAERNKVRKSGAEGFIRRRYAKRAELEPDDPWLRTAISSRLLDIVNAYLGLWAKLTYCDQWYTVPMPSGAQRAASQNWHRDHVDRHLVKVFIYLSDVDERAGPFEYVRGSTDDGPYANVWPWAPGGDHYPPRDEFEERIPPSAISTLTGTAGTMILCNTSGFHRGGFATETPRVLWRYNYASPASLVISERRFSVDPAAFDDASEAARFALT